VLGILSFDAAARAARTKLRIRAEAMLRMRGEIEAALRSAAPDMDIIAGTGERLPNTVCVRIPGVRADDLVAALDIEGVGISSGAACASGKPEPSHVLLAGGLSAAEARECIRISLRGEYAQGELSRGISALTRAVARMRSTRAAA
jgi:cysteine desulfurase